jgi:phosphatidylserine/phosphatidylglycerophosphate/cardiolipin synthase-like enzyme
MRLLLTLLISSVALIACNGAPSVDDMRHQFSTLRSIEGEAVDPFVQQAVESVDRAEESVRLAVENLESERLRNALIAAADRGVDVRVVTDEDLLGLADIVALDAALPRRDDGRSAVSAGDGALSYSPSPNTVVSRPGSDNVMSHNFVVVDELEVVTATNGFYDTSITQLGFYIASEEFGRDFADEFDHMFSGIFATTLSAFNGPLKSNTNNRTFYRTNAGRVELFFGPQERLTKRLVDEVYLTRSSVVVVTELLSSEPLADALRYKAEAGFDVTVIVEADRAEIESSRVAALEVVFEPLANARIVRVASVGGDAIVIDELPSPIDGVQYPARAYVSTQPVVAALGFVGTGTATTSRPADAFYDGHMFAVHRTAFSEGAPFTVVADSIRSAYLVGLQ